MRFSAFKQRVKSLPVFSASLLGTLTNKVETLQVQLSHWKKKGWVTPLRKGLYLLGPQDRTVEPPLFYLANQIFIPSYVSLEAALAHYRLIPEFTSVMTSVTVRKTCRFENALGLFTYQHVRPEGFFGFEPTRVSEGLTALLATPEKAVVDFLYLNLPRFSVSDPSVFTESYRFQNLGGLDPKRLRAYAKRFGTKKLLSVVELFIREILT